MKKLWYALLVVLLVGLCLYGLYVIEQQGDQIKEHERLISELKKELEYQNSVDHLLRNRYAEIQAQVDWDELYMWQYGTDKLSKADFAARVEDNPRISKNSLKIIKHTLPWKEEQR